MSFNLRSDSGKSQDGSVTLAFGRRYGLVGRNGTGKTTFLRHLAAHLIKGIPKNVQILHVEQEVRYFSLRSVSVQNHLILHLES